MRRLLVLLDAIALQPADARPTILALLLARAPRLRPMLDGAAASMAPQMQATIVAAGRQAVAALLDHLEPPGALEDQLARLDLGAAVAAARRLSGLLREVGGVPGRVAGLRGRLSAACRERFAMGLHDDLLLRLREGQGDGAAEALENAARHLRALESEGRVLGGAAAYDAWLARAVEAVRGLPAGGLLDEVEKLRLVEILAGPEAALAMVTGGGQGR
jgi:hypothetical protein